MLRAVVGIVALCFLATVGSDAASAVPGCASTATAIDFIQKQKITPLVLKRPAAKPLLDLAETLGWDGTDKVRALAVLFTPDGAAVFFVNEESTCGPMLIGPDLVKRYLRPA